MLPVARRRSRSGRLTRSPGFLPGFLPGRPPLGNRGTRGLAVASLGSLVTVAAGSRLGFLAVARRRNRRRVWTLTRKGSPHEGHERHERATKNELRH